MPRQIPLKRARDDGGELDGCAEIYLKIVVAIIALILVLSFCRTAISAINFLLPVLFVVISIILIAIAIENKSQIASWLETVKNQIEQWVNEHFVLTVVFLVLIIVCIILLIVVLGLTALQKGQ